MNEFSSVDKLTTNLTETIFSIGKSLGLLKTFNLANNKIKTNKPWFDNDCRTVKTNLKTLLALTKANNFGSDYLKSYLDLRKAYLQLIKCKNIEYEISISEKISNSANSKDFWSNINSFRKSTRPLNNLCRHTWEEFYNSMYEPRRILKCNFYDVRNRTLDL